MFPRCPKCKQALEAETPTCPACGLVFRKYLDSLAGAPARTPDVQEEPRKSLMESLVAVPGETPGWRIGAEAALLALSLFFGWRYYFMDIPDWEMAGSFLHGAMVPFHEFGHLAFRPFGEFMTLAGGSLAQWLMPIGFLLYFRIRNGDNFTASLMLWWTGTQFIDLAPYAWDALHPEHVLLTGRSGDSGAHDYIDLLGDLGLLKRAHGVARVMHEFGLVLMLAAWSWGALVLWRKWQQRRAA